MAAVTYSPFWGNDVNAYSLLDGKMPTLDRLRRVVNRDGFRAQKALLNALIGATAGGTATATHARISHARQTASAGIVDPGQATIVTVTDINRVTTAGDVTALKEFLVNVNVKPAFPRDLSGNGGPAQA